MADDEQKRIFAKNLNKYLALFNKTQKEVADMLRYFSKLHIKAREKDYK